MDDIIRNRKFTALNITCAVNDQINNKLDENKLDENKLDENNENKLNKDSEVELNSGPFFEGDLENVSNYYSYQRKSNYENNNNQNNNNVNNYNSNDTKPKSIYKD